MTTQVTRRRSVDARKGALPGRRRGTPLSSRRARAGYVAVLPALALVVTFFVIPMFLMFWMSLNNWPLLGSMQKFVGVQNYSEALDDETFLRSILFTLKYTLIVTPIQLLLGYGLAVLVRGRFRGVSAFRTAIFFPVVVGFASGAYVFLVLVQPEVGVFDQVLQALKLTSGPTPWLTDPDLALWVVILMITWKTVGTAVILLMIGMQAIPDEIREAGLVDGANWAQREWYITLPLMRPAIALVLILTLTGSFLAFDQFFVMTHGGPNQSTTTIVMWIYTSAFVRYRLGYSAALSLILLAILVIFTVIQMRALRDRSEVKA